MHIENGQEIIPEFLDRVINAGDKNLSYHNEKCNVLVCGIEPGAIMAYPWIEEMGTWKGAGVSMFIFDKDKHFRVAGN